MAGSDGDTKPWRRCGIPTGYRAGPAAERLVSGYGQVEALTEAVGVDPEQLPAGVQERAARGAGQQRSGVLNAAGYAAAARAAEGPLDAGDEAERHAQPTPARVRQGEDWHPDAGGRAGSPRERRSPAGIGIDDGDVGVDVVPGHASFGRAPVGEGEHYMIAAHVVRVRQHPPLAEHDARADAPALPDPHDRRAGARGQLPDACLYLAQDRHLHVSFE